VHNGLQGLIDLRDVAERAHTTHRIIGFALSQLSRDQRRYLRYALAQHLGIDLVELFERGQVMTLLNLDEIRRSASPGVMTTPRAPSHSRDVHGFQTAESAECTASEHPSAILALDGLDESHSPLT